MSEKMPGPSKELATIGGGCFWCVEAVYLRLRGVEKVVSGYAGGRVPHPTYRQVCEGTTGHAEVVQVTFDPEVLPYQTLLKVFFTAAHDPTTKDRQGHDIGTQYRSVIFYHSELQRQTAVALVKELDAERIYPAPIVTEVSPLPTFYPAEDYHQDYYALNPNQGYCRSVVAPKVDKFKKLYASLLAPKKI
eukprot:ANDGO_07706.mRNA.1 Peptide methionine sulfoxide reductase MsrA